MNFLKAPKLSLANYGKDIRSAPREVVFNRHVILSAIVYAMAAVPATWDQGSSSAIPSLPGFQQSFGVTSGGNASQIRDYISIVYIGYAAGAALSFFINDAIGRLWSYRLYTAVWVVGQLVATFANGMPALYASRIITGLGIGALTVTGPMSIVEIAPQEIRGILASWFVVAMSLSLVSSTFCVYGVFVHIPASKLQYQVVCFSPCIFMAICVIATFFLCESPKWLLMVNRREEAVQTLVKLRGLPLDHTRVQSEIHDMESVLNSVEGGSWHNRPSFAWHMKTTVKDMFTVPSNLRRLQQCLMSYALAQLSGANSVTSYLVPILTMLGQGGGESRHLFLTGMYAFSKLCFTLIASFLFVDAFGRRKSLFIGITVQMISDVYLGVFIKYQQQEEASTASGKAATAALFIHAFGYAVGLYTLPYVFGGELWPNHLRSFGGALGQTFHWLFMYAMNFGVPSLLERTNNWGAFIFFACWCLLAIGYVYLLVPEVAGLGAQDIEDIFKGSWLNAYQRTKRSGTVESVEYGKDPGWEEQEHIGGKDALSKKKGLASVDSK